MDKKTISVIGCCMARNIFNAPHMIDVFKVDNFAFQVVPWSIYESPLDIPDEVLDRVANSQFEKSIYDYDLNDHRCSLFENCSTDYIVIDLIACSFVLYEIIFNGKTRITRVGLGDKLLDRLAKDEYIIQNGGLKYNKISYKDVPDEYVKEKMDLFIEWLDNKYRREQIIFCMPSFPRKWIDKELCVKLYDEQKLKNVISDENYVKNLTNYCIKRLSGCKVYEFPHNMIAEEWGFKFSQPYHQTNMDYIRQANKMLSLLEIDYKQYYTKDLDPISYMLELWTSKYYSARKMIFDIENNIFDAKVNDCFEGTSLSSVSTQPFGKNLLCLKDLNSKQRKIIDEEMKKKKEVDIYKSDILVNLIRYLFKDSANYVIERMDNNDLDFSELIELYEKNGKR